MGVAAVVGLVVGFEPAKLPPAILNIAVYKLTFVAAAGLLAAGAVMQRYTRRRGDVAADAAAKPPDVSGERPILPEPLPDPIGDRSDRDFARARGARKHSL